MEDFDLLDAVQPSQGWFAIVGIKDGYSKQVMAPTRAEADRAIVNMLRAKRDVYYAMAKFGDPSLLVPDHEGKTHPRAKDNVVALKSLWIDVDCGPKKPYPTQQDGLRDVGRFLKESGLPMPTIVNSGGGLHCYWILEQEVTREEWEPKMAWLKAMCDGHGLHTDAKCYEAARILRVPGTANLKLKKPRIVSVVHVAPPVPFAAFGTGATPAPKPTPISTGPVPGAGRGLSPLMQSAVDSDRDALFDNIIGPDGCQQMKAAYDDPAGTSEPLWHSAISIANRCIDHDTAIHRVSVGHPDYTKRDTERKAATSKLPHTCVEFGKSNPGGCAGCPHKGIITSPIELGAPEPDEEDAPVDVRDKGEIATLEEMLARKPLPWGYTRTKKGIFKNPPKDKPEKAPELVYPHDFFVKKRMNDSELGAVAVLWVKHPMDGIQEFTVSCKDLADPTACRNALAAKFIMAGAERGKLLHEYIRRSIARLQVRKKADTMHTQFGWANSDKAIVVGSREVMPSGTFHTHPSETTRNMAQHMDPVGTFEKWKEVADLYGEPGHEAHAFAMGTAWGSLLLKYSGLNGAIINLIHKDSGTGKTTVLHMCNSVWGHPMELCSGKDDSYVTKVHKLGVWGSLPATFDELTNMEPKDLSNLAYAISQGIGKDRMEAGRNRLRVNDTRWKTIALCSSNASFYDKLESLKASPEGEQMRIIEIYLPKSNVFDVVYGKSMFDHQLKANYGHAGVIFAEWLINHQEDAEALYHETQHIIDTAFKLTQRERFWSAVIAANITGIIIAKRLGLVDWDLQRIMTWLKSLLKELRETTEPPAKLEQQLIAQFVAENVNNTLVVNGAIDRRSKMGMQSFPMMQPKGSLKIRYEPDTKHMYVNVEAFRQYCQDRKHGYNSTVKQLIADGVCITRGSINMSKGMAIDAPTVRVLMLNTNHSDLRHVTKTVEDVAEKEAEAIRETEQVPEVAAELAAAAAFEAEQTDAGGRG